MVNSRLIKSSGIFWRGSAPSPDRLGGADFPCPYTAFFGLLFQIIFYANCEWGKNQASFPPVAPPVETAAVHVEMEKDFKLFWWTTAISMTLLVVFTCIPKIFNLIPIMVMPFLTFTG